MEWSYAHGASSVPLLGEPVGDNLRRTVTRVPHQDALVVHDQGFRCTYSELWERVTELARALMSIGTKKGDRVGMWAPNRHEWVLMQFATARIGAILVNINPAYRAGELEYALNQSGASVLVMAERFRTADYLAIFEEVRANCKAIRYLCVLELHWQHLLAQAKDTSPDALAAREATVQSDDPVNIQYTSGTTGRPKGATLSHHNILNNGYFVARELRYGESDRVCIPVPFYHCFGMVIGNLACVTAGATIVIPGEGFDAEATLQAVERERCTSLYGVPTMFVAMLNHPNFAAYDCSSLRTGVMAGSPCPIEVMRQVQSRMHMTDVTICYGMTETSPVSTQTRIDTPLDLRVATVGTVHPHVEVKIIDPESGQTVPRGAPGELCTRGYSVMLGYWNDEAGTQGAVDTAGWMHTGDLAAMDTDGYIRITGRLKDMICRGGENIYPREVEELLYTHPAVEDVQVIGVPSEKYIEEVMAWVKLRAGFTPSEGDLVAFCKDKIAAYKIPRYWKFVDAFPMTVTGKVQKFRMREACKSEL